MTDQPKKPEWEERFIKEFVNTHNQTWRPLRGLWVEDVIAFIREVEREAEERGKVKGIEEYKAWQKYLQSLKEKE